MTATTQSPGAARLCVTCGRPLPRFLRRCAACDAAIPGGQAPVPAPGSVTVVAAPSHERQRARLRSTPRAPDSPARPGRIRRWRAVALAILLAGVCVAVALAPSPRGAGGRPVDVAGASTQVITRRWAASRAAIASKEWGELRRNLTTGSVSFVEEMHRLARGGPTEDLTAVDRMVAGRPLPARLDSLLALVGEDTTRVVATELVEPDLTRARLEDGNGQTFHLFFRKEDDVWKLDLIASATR